MHLLQQFALKVVESTSESNWQKKCTILCTEVTH